MRPKEWRGKALCVSRFSHCSIYLIRIDLWENVSILTHRLNRYCLPCRRKHSGGQLHSIRSEPLGLFAFFVSWQNKKWRADRKWNRARKPQGLPPLANFSRLALPPKTATTFQSSEVTWELNVQTHNLGGIFHIQSTICVKQIFIHLFVVLGTELMISWFNCSINKCSRDTP